MGGKAGSLIGLKHIVGPAVLRHEFKVRIQNASRIVYKLELRSGWTGAGARNIARAIHPATVIHAEERSMAWLRSKVFPSGTGSGLVTPVGEFLSSHATVEMLYWRAVGVVLHE